MSQNGKISVRRSEDRGQVDHGWLRSFHTFSFASYDDPNFRGFRSLRVLNDDTVEPGQGFGRHPHKNMEIISYVIEGELEHKDSMGNGSVIRVGNFQLLSAGQGITHSEFNPSKERKTHFLQIWIEPDTLGLEPSYQELDIAKLDAGSGLSLIGQKDAQDGMLKIHQEVKLFFGRMNKGEKLDVNILPARGVWLHVISGQIGVLGHHLNVGDALAAENAEKLEIHAQDPAEFLLFDLA